MGTMGTLTRDNVYGNTSDKQGAVTRYTKFAVSIVDLNKVCVMRQEI